MKAGSLDLSPNVVDIGTNAYKAQGGWNVVTGTVVQPGGFLSAMRMDIDAGTIHAVNDAFRITRADGTVDEEASAALVAQLKESLGLNYTEDTLQDDIHTRFIKEKKGFGIIGQIVAMVAAVAISIVTAGAGAVVVTAAFGATFAGSVMGVALSAAISGLVAGTLSSMVTQVITTGSLNLGAALKAGAVSGLTAGLTQGAMGALDLSSPGVTSFGDNIAKGDWTAVQANLGSYVEASVVRSAISAGVNTVAYGGSFGQAFVGGLVRDAAAVGANAVGVSAPGIGMPGSDSSTILTNVLGHALVGCAAQSLTGGDCAGGAIGGAASAIAAPLIRDEVYADSNVINYSDDKVRQAITVGLATLIGGATGALLGADVTSAGMAAQNEALNNATSGSKKTGTPDEIRKFLDKERAAFGQTRSTTGNGLADAPVVSPSPLVLGGARSPVPVYNAQGAARAAANSGNWSDGSLSQTIQNIAGSNAQVTYTTSGKTVYTNPSTGASVVYDNAGNYFRVQSSTGQYLDKSGSQIPNNVPLVGNGKTTQTGVPSGVRNGLTHFKNDDARK
ncbi:DUF637 domain-containing protein [Cupriavidus sp. SIMBA_020]|uniref:DUF637 domain-containing protein n=1 Tax=Cupriavidus sp. SIMBA_020 TaxID=3085766 RepID=UPI003977EEA1